jgi:PhnB protein
MANVRAVPEGMHTLTPQLTVDDGVAAMEFYKKAFGAQELARAMDTDGKKLMHGELRIGDSTFFVNDSFPEMGGDAPKPTSLWLYVDQADALFKRAVDAGAKVTQPMEDQFWGDRLGMVQDRWGNRWNIAQHIKDLSPAEQQQAQQEWRERNNKKRK